MAFEPELACHEGGRLLLPNQLYGQDGQWNETHLGNLGFAITEALTMKTKSGTRQSSRWCRKVGGKLENWRKLLIVKHSERRCAAAERSLRHETSYGIDVAQSIFGENWFDPLEDAIRFRVRAFIEAVVAEEAASGAGRPCAYQRSGAPKGYRNGTGIGSLSAPFGALDGFAPPRPPARWGWR